MEYQYEINNGVFQTDFTATDIRQDAMWFGTSGFDFVGQFTHNNKEHQIYAVGEMKLILRYGGTEETIYNSWGLLHSGVWEYLAAQPSDYNFMRLIEHSPLPTVSVEWENNNWFEISHPNGWSEPCYTLDDVFQSCVDWVEEA